jgi:hypothetical protein
MHSSKCYVMLTFCNSLCFVSSTLCAATFSNNYKNLTNVFPEKELRTLRPNSYSYVSMSDIFIPRIDPQSDPTYLATAK